MKRLFIVIAVTFAACGDDSHQTTPDAAPDANTTPTARFAPLTGPMDFAAVPYPFDLYLNSSGGVQLATLPTGGSISSAVMSAINDALAQDHGFGMTTAIFFGVDNVSSLDAAKLMQNVHLVDLADGTEVALLQPALHVSTSNIWAQPAYPLKANHKYGAWIDPGLGLAESPAFTQAKGMATPSDPAQARAHDILAPLWAAPANIPRDRAVTATVFTTHEVNSGITKLKQASDGLTPPVHDLVIHDSTVANDLDGQLGIPIATTNPGIDNPGQGTTASDPRYGVVHDHIAYIIHGSFDAPNYLSANRAENGVISFDATGAPQVKSTEAIRFTLVLPPATAGSYANQPVAIFMYGLQQERHHIYAMANTLAAQGVATLAFDLLFHGDRAFTARDLKNNSTNAGTPDGMGDDAGLPAALQYLAAGPRGANVRMSDPLFIRDDMRQSVADMFTAIRLIKAGNWTMLTSDPRFSTLTFRGDRIVLMPEGFGTPISMIAAFYDTDVTAVVGSQPSGGLFVPFMVNTPSYATMLIPIFGNLFNISGPEFSNNPERHPILTVYQQVIEPGDALALIDGPVKQHTFIVQPFSDEVSANQDEEEVEKLWGIPALGGGMYRYQQLETGTLPATGNVSGKTVGVVQFMPATWDLYMRGTPHQGYMPDFPPFVAWCDMTTRPQYCPDGMTINNPIVQVQTMMWQFIKSHFDAADGVPTIPVKP